MAIVPETSSKMYTCPSCKGSKIWPGSVNYPCVRCHGAGEITLDLADIEAVGFVNSQKAYHWGASLRNMAKRTGCRFVTTYPDYRFSILAEFGLIGRQASGRHWNKAERRYENSYLYGPLEVRP